MADQYKTLFLSDLHLHKDQPENARRFIQFLKSCDTTIDSVYILGDLFEVWIGDDDRTPFHLEIINALNTATKKGLKIFVMRGNRDFHLGTQFGKETGCQLLSDEEKIYLYGTPILLMHGDLLCTNDHAYLRMRRFLHNKIIRFIFLHLPLWLRRKITNKIRSTSTKHNQSTSLDMMDVEQNAVDSVMQKHAVNHLIHGHTHKQAIHEWNNKTRIVLPSWDHHPQVLEWKQDGTFNWIDC